MLAGLAVLPGAAAAQPVDPSVVVASGPSPVRAAGSFALVLLFGGAVLYLYEGFVDRSIDSSMERPLVSVVYGAIAYGLVVFIGGYASTQLARFGGGTVLPLVGAAVFGAAVLALAGLGFAVVGTRLTEVRGERRHWLGLVVGAAVSALAWLALPLLPGLLVWVAVAAVGIGGPTRNFIHDSRAAESELES